MMLRVLCVMHLFYSAAKPKALAHVLFISIIPRVALELHRPTLYSVEATAPLFESRKGGHFSANCFLEYLQTVDYLVQPYTHRVAPSSPNLPTKVSAFVC